MTTRTLGLIVLVAALASVLSGRLTSEADARAAAELVACRGVTCETELVRSKRTLFGWELELEAYDDDASDVVVTCTRRLYVFGSLDCHVSHQNPRYDKRVQ